MTNKIIRLAAGIAALAACTPAMAKDEPVSLTKCDASHGTMAVRHPATSSAKLSELREAPRSAGGAEHSLYSWKRQLARQVWPVAGLLDPEMGCFHPLEVPHGKREGQPRVQALDSKGDGQRGLQRSGRYLFMKAAKFYYCLMNGVATVEKLQSLLRAEGVRTAYVKHLSPKQDNDKNQIYLGGGLDDLPPSE